MFEKNEYVVTLIQVSTVTSHEETVSMYRLRCLVDAIEVFNRARLEKEPYRVILSVEDHLDEKSVMFIDELLTKKGNWDPIDQRDKEFWSET